MNFYIPFETALQLLTIAYLASVMLLLAASSICLVVTETIEADDG
jgi:hypothetical protein